MSNEVEIEVQQVDGALAELVTRAEYDVQIATARKYPRSVKQFMNTAKELVTLTEEIADECIYALPREGKNIEGPSARFAEIMLHSWGHSRAGARVINDDGRFVTAQGVCHDLQNNTLIAYEVKRRITNRAGKRFNDDMIGVTANAACSIALRNSILKVIPKALWSPLYEEAKRVVIGDVKTLANRRAKALELMQKFGATPEMVFRKLGVGGAEDISLDHLIILRGFANALKEGEFTVESIFNPEAPGQSNSEKLNKKYLDEGKESQGEILTTTSISDSSNPAMEIPPALNSENEAKKADEPEKKVSEEPAKAAEKVEAPKPTKPKEPKADAPAKTMQPIPLGKTKDGKLAFDAYTIFLKQAFEVSSSANELQEVWAVNEENINRLKEANLALYENAENRFMELSAKFSKAA